MRVDVDSVSGPIFGEANLFRFIEENEKIKNCNYYRMVYLELTEIIAVAAPTIAIPHRMTSIFFMVEERIAHCKNV